jgi:hypothetical protein
MELRREIRKVRSCFFISRQGHFASGEESNRIIFDYVIPQLAKQSNSQAFLVRLFEHFTTRPSLKQAARGTENEANKASWMTSKIVELHRINTHEAVAETN